MIKRKTILAGVTAAAVILSSGIMAFAASDTTGTTDSRGHQGKPAILDNLTAEQREAVNQVCADSMKEAVADLVENGVITQDLADKLSEGKGAAKEQKEVCSLTEEQRAALHEGEAAEFENQLSALVDDGTLTQDQADQLTNGKMMRKGLDLTEEQRTAVMEAKANAVKEAAANLVEEGTLTQEQADEISAIQPMAKFDQNRLSDPLTEEQRTELHDAMKTILESKLTDLVNDGTLTQEQADQLLSGQGAMRMGPGGKPGFGGHPDFKGRLNSEAKSSEEQTL